MTVAHRHILARACVSGTPVCFVCARRVLDSSRRCRDDITAQPNHRRLLRQRAKEPEELEKALQQLGMLIDNHVEQLMERTRVVSGAPQGGAFDASALLRPEAGAIDMARTLFHAATAPRLLCAQEASFHPWF